MERVFADLRLAALLEGLVANEMRRFVSTACRIEPDGPSTAMEVDGGVAIFLAPRSPVNQAVGLGLQGKVVADDIERIERFFLSRGSRPVVNVCPLAHPSLVESLGARGWTAGGFENVLVRELDEIADVETPAGIRVIEVTTAEERELWALVAATAFSAPLDPLPDQLVLAEVVSERPGARLFLALVDGRPAGTGELFIEEGVGWLSADATLPQFRGRGVQSALQARRLAEAQTAGCRLAVSEAAPGSGSQRNMERQGFRVVYTRMDFTGPRPGDR